MKSLTNNPVFVRALPFALYIAFLALEGALDGSLDTTVQLWLYPLKVGVVAVVLFLFWSKYEELRVVGAGAMGLLLSVAVGVGVFALWIVLVEPWMLLGSSRLEGGYEPLEESGRLAWHLVAMRIAGAALVVPLMEELFWRSFLQRWVANQDFLAQDPARVGFKALFIASALFALEHTQWFAGLLAGLAYGLLYMRLRSLWSAIIAHSVTNALLGVYVVLTGKWYFW